MKKGVLAVFVIAAISVFFACTKKEAVSETSGAGEAVEEVNNDADVVLITDGGDVSDKSFNEAAFSACQKFCDDHSLRFAHFKPADDSAAARISSADEAMAKNPKILVLSGDDAAGAFVSICEKFGENSVKIIATDLSEADVKTAAADLGYADWALPANAFCASFKEEIAGFLAGYAAVMQGYCHLGFVGNVETPAMTRCGYGFVRGANAAAADLELSDPKLIQVEYVYVGQKNADAGVTETMKVWYGNQRRVEVIFACGGNLCDAVGKAALDFGGKVIGFGVDQKERIDAFADGMCVASAVKNIDAMVKMALEAALDSEKWTETCGGKFVSLGIASADDVESNFVKLSTKDWAMRYFSVEDYKALVAKIFDGTVSVSDDIEQIPDVSIGFVTYPKLR